MGDLIQFPTNHGSQIPEQTDQLVSGVSAFERKLSNVVKDAEELLGDVVVRNLYDNDPEPPMPVA